MITKAVTEVLKSIGWNAYRDEVGDRGAVFILPDRIVNIVYDIKKSHCHQDFRVILSLSTENFSLAYRKIRDNCDRYSPLIVAWNWPKIRTDEIKEEHIHQASHQTIEWAKEQDLHKALLNHAALPTSAPGTGPVLHLSALVLLGEIEKLKSYQASFEAGDRLGFVPYITKDFIDRAVTIAEKNASQ